MEVEDVPPKKLTYILSILSAEEATKTVSKRTPISMALELGDKEPWDTLKAQLLMKIDTAPPVLKFDDYTVLFYISRVLPRPGMVLETEDSYLALLLRAANLKSKTSTINLTIQEKKHSENKENEGASGAEQKEGSKDKKRYIEPAVLPGNVSRAENIRKLQNHWKCEKREPSCLGAYCYDSEEPGSVHLPLNHERLECWASAMLKNDDSATVEKPPNHRLFDPKSAPLSPVLQRRLESQNAKSADAPSAPVFNISVGNAVLDLLQPRPAIVAHPEPPMLAIPSTQGKMLLDPARILGPDMPIGQFCDSFGLQPGIRAKLEANAYDYAQNLCFIALNDLTEMEFKLGEKAALQDAVERWSVPHVA
ncbi:hypothetical protein BYT27DRAFT_7080856 [Phlegmacium glaucopus]|nr:hypothetical protein BYT27DRAFT_7080856 [Phlegmacium glaucopus]